MIKEFDQVILGQIFITNFVTAFDLENNKISLTTNLNAPDGVKITLSGTKDDDGSGLGTGAIVGIVIGGIIVLVLVIVIVVAVIVDFFAGDISSWDVHKIPWLHNSIP